MVLEFNHQMEHMNDEFYLDLEGKTAGPFGLEQLRVFLEAGTITEETIFSTPRSVEWMPVKLLLPLLAGDGSRAAPQPASAGDWVCTRCHWVGSPKSFVRGSFLIEVVLWLAACLPGLIYTLWRLSTRGQCCGQCGALELIPVGSPRGQEMATVPQGSNWGAEWSARFGRWCGRTLGRIWRRCASCAKWTGQSNIPGG